MNKLLIPLVCILAFVPFTVFAETWNYSDLYQTKTVTVGEKINFTNTDARNHSIAGIDKNGNEISTGVIEPNQTVQFQFLAAGVFDFKDEFSNNNQGTINVLNADGSLDQTTNSGTANGWASKTIPVFLSLPQNQVVVNQTVTIPTNSTNNTSTPLMINPTSIGLPNSTNWVNPNIVKSSGSSDNPTVPANVTSDQFKALNDKIDQLNAKIDSLTEKLDAVYTIQNSIFGSINQILQYFHIG